MTVDLVFYTGMALLLVHELDAVHRHEWRMFPVLSGFDDRKGFQLFVLLHVPLLVLIFWLMFHPIMVVRYWFFVVMDIFFIVHAALHYLLKKHKHNRFSGDFSIAIIAATAAAGMLHLALLVFGP